MVPVKELDYGTVEPTVVQERSNGKIAATVLGGLLCAAVLAVSFSTSSSKIDAVVNSNAGTDDELAALFKSTCDDKNLRYAIATFDADEKEIIRCQSAKATDQWIVDYDNFKDALESCASLNSMGVAFAVYNMPVWKNERQEMFEVYPTFVRYEQAELDISDRIYAATFLGSVMIDAQCAASQHNIEIKPSYSYQTACQQLSFSNTDQCSALEEIACPFGYADDTTNPCNTVECKKVVTGGTFFSIEGNLGENCCTDIKGWCTDLETKGRELGQSGCTDFKEKHIYRNHCEEGYVAETDGEEIYYHPTLIAEEDSRQEAADAAAAKKDENATGTEDVAQRSGNSESHKQVA